MSQQVGRPVVCDRCHARCDGGALVAWGCRTCDYDLCPRCVGGPAGPAVLPAARPPPCRYHLAGGCRNGAACKFDHGADREPIAPPAAPPGAAAAAAASPDAGGRGRGAGGGRGRRRLAEADPRGHTPCRYYLREGGCKAGAACPYSHGDGLDDATRAQLVAMLRQHSDSHFATPAGGSPTHRGPGGRGGGDVAGNFVSEDMSPEEIEALFSAKYGSGGGRGRGGADAPRGGGPPPARPHHEPPPAPGTPGFVAERLFPVFKYDPAVHKRGGGSDADAGGAADEEENCCSVCLCDFTAGEPVLVLPCMHWFHKPCVSEWLTKQPTCPNCTLDVRQAGASLLMEE